ncbi:presenilin [Anaeramoeba ignava]|uniref:Presenilin n=1 Tax=Anaeramoeba ignava TaxID=1746090 RepID=A0A9Q0RH70_ANAIG|nr:presenilin [Anaeramoeba ignava]
MKISFFRNTFRSLQNIFKNLEMHLFPLNNDYIQLLSQKFINILFPVSLSMISIIIIMTNIYDEEKLQKKSDISELVIFPEKSSDPLSKKIIYSIINAFFFIFFVVLSTLLLIYLLKKGLMKIIFGWVLISSSLSLAALGGNFFLDCLKAVNFGMDWFSFLFILYNISVVGVIVLFWKGPKKIQQGYLILIGILVSITISQLPKITTWVVLILIAFYGMENNIFAVLSTKGPLKILISQSRNKKIDLPGFIYTSCLWIVHTNILNTNENIKNNNNNNNNNNDEKTQSNEKDFEILSKWNIKLGLGDFIFYNVLITRACFYDYVAVISCFIAILVGLSFTLFLLFIFRSSLPALPLSILFGLLSYFFSKFSLVYFVKFLGRISIFV